ncbi:MAG: hypothetical protein NVS3B26_19160 [Mycobacteriales bacterium]
MGFRRRYGAQPLHLLSLLACFSLAGYAALQAVHGPLPLRMAAWFLGALLGHDLVIFPLYALADRALLRARRRSQQATGMASTINFLRVPAMLSGLLLLMFYPVILHRSEGPYGAASGLDESVYLARWLLLTGVLFTGSALLFLLRRRQR